MAIPAQLIDGKAQDFAKKIGQVFQTLPHLPKGITEFFVKITPVFALIGAVLSLFAGPVLGLFSMLTLLTGNPFIVLSTVLAAALAIASAALLFLAYKPLQSRHYNGWMLLFWVNVIGALSTVLQIVFGNGQLSNLIGTLISFYILYEMQPFYGFSGKIESVKGHIKNLTR